MRLTQLTRVIPSRLLPEVVCMSCFARSLAGMLFFWTSHGQSCMPVRSCAVDPSLSHVRTCMQQTDRHSDIHVQTLQTITYIHGSVV